MRNSTMALSAATLSMILSGCSTSDALTPQVDVGGGLRPSSPVTQAEVDRMAASPRQDGYASVQNSFSPTEPPRAPQNTLEAQAQALQDGNASAVGYPTSPALSAATPVSPAEPPREATASRQTASLPSTAGGTIRFLPIIGAPVQSVTPLSRQLGAQARTSGLAIRASGDSSADHILKGYFSAFADGSSVTVVYVWDVLDNGGSRLHRLQGQVQVPASSADPWASVPPTTMEMIATKTINEYVAWKQSQPG